MSKEKDVQWSCPSLYTDIVGRTIGLHIYRKHLYSSEELFIMPYIYIWRTQTCILIFVYDFKMKQKRWLVKYVRVLYKYKLVHRVKLSSG